MKLAAGSLRDVLKWKFKTGFPEEDEVAVARILYETLEGLDVLHNSHIIHRDIKTSNILYGEDGVILLADFGVSAILNHTEEKRQTMAGTWHWMAPEVIDPGSSGYDIQADIWSLGITTIELAYGEAPYGNERPTEVVVHISTDEPPSMENPHTPFFYKRKFSNLLSDFVSCCLKMDPSKRKTTKQLLNHNLFNSPGVKSLEATDLARILMADMPTIEKRFAEIQERKRAAAQARFGNGMQGPARGNRAQSPSCRPPKNASTDRLRVGQISKINDNDDGK
jgi:serine/threonine protein kinase